MANIGKMLKDDIQRLARKELKAAVSGLRRVNVALKQAVADYKRRITDLERSNTNKIVAPQLEAAGKPSPEAADRARFTGRMVRSIREKLGLSQADFARLVGVSDQSIYHWEGKDGRLTLRRETKPALLEVRGLGVREARRRLEAMKEGSPTKPRKGGRGVAAKPAKAEARKPGRPPASKVKDTPVTGKMIRDLRKKLGISQADFARLADVNAQSVYQWEHKPGRLTFRGNTRQAILEVIQLSAQQVSQRLEGSGKTAPAKSGGRGKAVAKPAKTAGRKTARTNAASPAGGSLTGRTIRAMRKKLGISQADLGKLLDLHSNTIYQWEHKPGPLQLRANAKAGVLAIQRMGAEEVKKRLSEINGASAKKRGPRGRKKRKG